MKCTNLLVATALVVATAASAHAADRRFFSGEGLYGAPMRGALGSDLADRAMIDEAAKNGDTFRRDTYVTQYSSTTILCQNNVSNEVVYGGAFTGDATTDVGQTTTCNNSGNGSSTLNNSK